MVVEKIEKHLKAVPKTATALCAYIFVVSQTTKTAVQTQYWKQTLCLKMSMLLAYERKEKNVEHVVRRYG